MIKKLSPPPATIRRLSVYLRCLNALDADNAKVISSHELAKRLALNPAQVRKDLAYFGELGKRGVGYTVKKLRDHLVTILGLQTSRKVGIIGAGGRLGTALSMYSGFAKRNFQICALFDNDPETIGAIYENVGVIRSVDELPKAVKELGIDILILTVPAGAIKKIYDMVMLSGVRAILNFAPFKMISTEYVFVHNVDLTTELESLSYRLSLSDTDTDTDTDRQQHR